MSDFKESLLEEQAQLAAIQKQLLENRKDHPEGSLRVASRNGHPQYYHSGVGKGQGIYIPQTQPEMIRQLAQKDYEQKVLTYVEKRLPKINRLTKVYEEKTVDEIYLSEIPERKKWIKPVKPIWEETVRAWAEVPYKALQEPKDNDFWSKRGEHVRSKSEKILADMFEENGLYYKYECPIYLEHYGWVYPDFTFLSPYTFQEVYWEHLGRMDRTDYVEKNVRKIKWYEKNHIYPGEQLILTYETEHNQLDTQLAQQMIDHYLLKK